MKEIIKEELEVVAERVPPGDKWKLRSGDGEVIEGLVETLNQYVRNTKFRGHYRLAPLDGYLYAIKEIKEDAPPPVVYDLYGEGYEQ